MRSIKVKGYTDVIDAGIKRVSEFRINDFISISHFIICKSFIGYWKYLEDRTTFKDMFLKLMAKYEIESAILTTLDFGRLSLKTRETVDQEQAQFEKYQRRGVSVDRLLSEDLESFYTSLQNPKLVPKEIQREETANIFLTQKLTEVELTLLKSRNSDYLNTFYWYQPDAKRSVNFDNNMKKIGKSSDPESIFSHSVGNRWTTRLKLPLELPLGLPLEIFNALISNNSELTVSELPSLK